MQDDKTVQGSKTKHEMQEPMKEMNSCEDYMHYEKNVRNQVVAVIFPTNATPNAKPPSPQKFSP